MILPANVYDSLFSTDILDVNQAQVLGTAVHASSEAGTQCVEVVRWGGQDVAATGVNGVPKVDLTHVNAAAQTATLDTIKAETVLIVADTGELQTDWVQGGRLDLLIDKAAEAQDAHTDTTLLLTNVGTVDTVVDLIEDILRNRLEINDATGAVSLKNDAGVELLTGTVTDDSTTTIRTRLA